MSQSAKARYEAKRSARLAADPEARKARNKAREDKRRERMRSDPTLAKKVYAQRNKGKRGKRRQAADARPFVGCDGEGAGRGSDHRYLLFRMGDRALETGERLTTPELLQFIVAHPDAKAILVAFAFEYDISNILRDVPTTPEQGDRGPEPSRLERILRIDKGIMAGEPNPYDRAFGWVWLKFPGYPEFGVSYIPRNYLKVCLASTFTLMVNGEPRTFKQSVPGSSRTIFDTFGFFQCSFLKAIETWGVGQEHHAGIAAMKAARSTFEGITPAIRDYCAIECELLAQLMEAFRAVCHGAGLRPKTWNGPGKIAAALLAEHAAMTAVELEKKTPGHVLELAHAAYYGGRFEVTRVGEIAQKVWEHDINSAYPAAMLDLPCLDHGHWIKTPAATLKTLDGLFVAPVRFAHPRDQFLCGLPFRSKSGRLSWPRHGNGVYWSPEIRSAERLGARIEYRDGYRFEQKCQCQNFGWIADLYEERRRVGKALKGIALKLGYNSVYGKQAQRVGTPRWANPINAGLITAITRAKLNDAIGAARDPQDVAMIATDGIYTVERPIPLDRGEGLGQWEVKDYPRLFVVRPGLYWPPKPRQATGKPAQARRLKTRGLSPKFFEPRCGAFERAWRGYVPGALTNWTGPPAVGVEVETFVGLRLAFRLGRPADACQWIVKTIECKFEWSGDKRAGFAHTLDGKALVLFSKAGSPDAYSAHYEPGAVLASADQFEIDRMLFEANPDYVDLSPPHK